ncbi:E3 ubiquitin-protein ligase TRIM32 [Frankliniella fusca]|uniref:E3 ubiquitin-protein ligase TRIM32 n=1 Tax=Frankliniella fusca TaxID=407009 RepID=A0AAE1HFQ5_9NEOP|nr:E3 ubiquitin-protein ligase TRIM32 [Frankliniella fusca]
MSSFKRFDDKPAEAVLRGRPLVARHQSAASQRRVSGESAGPTATMDCTICIEDYNEEERVPKSLPCGHTVCLQCLQRMQHLPRTEGQQCPKCRRPFTGRADDLPNNFEVLRLMQQGDGRCGRPRDWCWDCRAAPAPRCREEHDVLAAKAALRRHLPAEALQQAVEQLQGLQRHAQEDDALRALTLLSAPSWDLTLRAGGRRLDGTLANTEDPLTKVLWAVVASKAALTESVDEEPPPAAAALDPPPAEAPPPREMDVEFLSCSALGVRQEEKAAALQEAQGCTVHTTMQKPMNLIGRWCGWSGCGATVTPPGAWSCCSAPPPRWSGWGCSSPASPTCAPCTPCRGCGGCSFVVMTPWTLRPPELGALPPGHSGLRWLSVFRLPRATLQSLLQAHGGTLEELELAVGTPGERTWPESCSDLHSLLGRCGLRALRTLVLWRGGCRHTDCGEQLAAVRAALPGVQQVLCEECDRVQEEDP